MSESSLSIDFTKLKKAVSYQLGLGSVLAELSAADDELVEDIVQTGYRRFIFPPPTSDRLKTHEWSFLTPTATLLTDAPYSTGTVAVVNGVVTLSGGTNPSWAASGEMVIESDDVAADPIAVSVRTDDTHVTLVNTSVNVTAGATYTLYRASYSFLDSYAGLLYQEFIYRSSGPGICKIPVRSDSELRNTIGKHFVSGVPRIASLRPSQFSGGTKWEVAFAPFADAVYELEYRYNFNPDAMATLPLGGMKYSDTILESCLAYAEEKVNDNSRQHRDIFDLMLRAAIQLDENMNSTDSLGISPERYDSKRAWFEKSDLPQVSYARITPNF